MLEREEGLSNANREKATEGATRQVRNQVGPPLRGWKLALEGGGLEGAAGRGEFAEEGTELVAEAVPEADGDLDGVRRRRRIGYGRSPGNRECNDETGISEAETFKEGPQSRLKLASLCQSVRRDSTLDWTVP